ncbi:hypothetical protein PHYSODRAFT_457046, partial [Phytophthora sojae]
EHLERCWEAYTSSPGSFSAPCTSVLLSFGFGKSRALQKLAEDSCAKLVAMYRYAQKNWEVVGEEWLELFTSQEADTKVAMTLQTAMASKAQTGVKKTSPGKPRVVVLAVDEARKLFQLDHNSVDHMDRLHKALGVADFMAILAYVTYKQDGILSSYDTEPVLALGATRVWYSLENGLSDFILPQFKRMLVDQTIDAGHNGEVVARIVLLLVMDAATMIGGEVRDHTTKIYHTFRFKGQYVSVASFLRLLVGASPQDVKAFREWESTWALWEMGFCQFVQLDEEPTEDTLWFLLGRRAAGVLPRNDKGIDLIIPIFSDADDAEVLMVLVQVNNLENDANCFLESAGAKMDPKRAFSRGNALRENSSADMIRVYLNLREQ